MALVDVVQDDEATVDPRVLEESDAEPQAPTASAIAARLVDAALAPGATNLIHIASDERRAEEIGRIVAELAGPAEIDALVFPPWDCLPYDRASPSRESMGQRMWLLTRLAAGSKLPRIVVASPEAVLQKVPPHDALASATYRLAVGDATDPDELAAFANATGYLVVDRVDEAGEIDIRGQVVDLFPPAADTPIRLDIEDGRITAIRRFDPATQRTLDAVETVEIGPASEVILPPNAADDAEPVERFAGMEHGLARHYAALETLFDYMPKAVISLDPDVEARCISAFEQIQDAYDARLAFPDEATAGTPHATSPPTSLYLDEAGWRRALKPLRRLDLGAPALASPDFVTQARPVRAVADFIDTERAAKRRVVLAGDSAHLKPLLRRLGQQGDEAPEPISTWRAVGEAAPGALLALEADVGQGFTDPTAGLTLIGAAQVLGAQRRGATSADVATAIGQTELRFGDVVIHEDHGVGVLRALETVEIGGATQETARLEYHGGATLLVPVEELGRVWRYGSEEEAVHLDHLNTDAWTKRRAEVEDAVVETAQGLVALAKARDEAAAAKLIPPRAAYEQFARRFAFSLTVDQAAAIDAVLADLASGRPMDRLVCGDVGFGKTEVALRAAAAAVLAGKQVAIVAPTTVLVRQHVQTFERRFADLGIKVGHLSRLVAPAEAKAVKAALASGELRLVVGTQALAGKGVAFADLGLLVIDEEQKFGAKLKAGLRALGPDAHVLTLTATPIPRTLQMAMVGVQDVSVIATPPARRRPIRTFLTPFDPAAMRTALVREKARGGQSFLVVPRIEDIGPMQARLASLTPELETLTAHGELPAAEADAVMVRFADGQGDVLLATNIIESGLDVPRANTMLVWRADMFGLAQLHQLRGRVGRGRAQGVAYLLSDPEHELSEATRARLSALEAFDRLGAGLALSARDLDLRGAGDLVGEEQAGHMKLIGLGLYQSLLERAVRAAKGEPVDDAAPTELHLELSGTIPADYIPEPEVRLNLYARLSRLSEPEQITAFEDEVEDRFGAPPASISTLFALARVRLLAQRLTLSKLTAGPKAIAMSFAGQAPGGLIAASQSRDDLIWRDSRLIHPEASEATPARLVLVERLLEELAHAEPPASHRTPKRPAPVDDADRLGRRSTSVHNDDLRSTPACRAGGPLPRVMTTCPASGHVVPTGAVMTVKQFARLGSDLAIYCPDCRRPHLITRDRVWLEGAPEPDSGIEAAT